MFDKMVFDTSLEKMSHIKNLLTESCYPNSVSVVYDKTLAL